jgi:hypothetical protein
VASRERTFLEFYQQHRYKDQLEWYRSRISEFKAAQAQAKGLGVTFMIIAALGSFFASASFIGPFRLPCLIIAAIFPVLYTTLAAYNTLYGFDQQAKLYQDTAYRLAETHTISPDLQKGLSEQDFAARSHEYVNRIEDIFLVEQGQWGQLAEKMRPPDV